LSVSNTRGRTEMASLVKPELPLNIEAVQANG